MRGDCGEGEEGSRDGEREQRSDREGGVSRCQFKFLVSWLQKYCYFIGSIRV